jgi:hypothetical protein
MSGECNTNEKLKMKNPLKMLFVTLKGKTQLRNMCLGSSIVTKTKLTPWL